MDIGNLVSTFFKTAGPGGVLVLVIYLTAFLIYVFLTRWILGDRSPEPTPSPEPTESDQDS